MIQFNLLPDVKLKYVKTQRTKRMAMSVSVIVGAAALGILLILFLVVDVWQKKSISDLNHDINTYSSQIKNTPNLNKILTVQNQLKALPSLDGQKPVVNRLSGYLSQLTPNSVTISSLALDFSANTWTITGSADSLATVDKYVDTFKFTTYVNSSGSKVNAFSNVVLSSFGINNKTANYNITLSFDPNIFSSAQNVSLTVPNIISTRSSVDQPNVLFNKTNSSTSH